MDFQSFTVFQLTMNYSVKRKWILLSIVKNLSYNHDSSKYLITAMTDVFYNSGFIIISRTSVTKNPLQLL